MDNGTKKLASVLNAGTFEALWQKMVQRIKTTQASIPEADMDGPCPHLASTDREPCCLLGGICWGNPKTCQARRRTTCKFSDGQTCEDYDYCACRECQTPGKCLENLCESLCCCRTDETAIFNP